MEGKYKTMIYAATASFFMCSKHLEFDPNITVQEFRDKNPELIKEVFKDVLDNLEYELSYNQMSTAILAFLQTVFNYEKNLTPSF